ncbi:MAG: hypothetical protein C0490_17505, partial [Marivirga sp.]|nr:hypothetical protein [Marivirga sp.]
MKKLYPFALFTFLGFLNANGFQERENDNDNDNDSVSRNEQTDHTEDTFVYQSINTDSMLIERGEIYAQVYKFISDGIKVHDKNSPSWNCVSKIRQYVMGTDTLTTIKGDCDAGGFENHQFISRNGSLTLYRKYKMEKTVDGRTNLSEDIYEFK